MPAIWSGLGQETRLLRTKYRHLYELPVVEHADGSRSFHDGWLYRCHGLNVLFLRGDAVEMAFQHGRLLADQIPLGAVQGCAKLIDNAVANTLGSGGRMQNWVVERLQEFVSRRVVSTIRNLLGKTMPEAPALLEAVALADAAGLDSRQVIRALFNPEMLLMLAGLGRAGFPLSSFPPLAAPASCCTSFAAWDGATADGSLLVGRNLDYPLNGFYDAYPTVIYREPTGPALRHMSFGSAGVNNSGVTSYNEAGLFLAAHVVPSSDCSLSGVPALITADLASSQAKNVEGAADLFRTLPSVAGWSYLAVDTRRREASSLEFTNRQFARRSATGDSHVQTNRFLAPEMHGRNLFLNASVDDDTNGRYERAQQRLTDARGRLDAMEAISILSDQVDPQTNEDRGLGNTIGVHTTLTSVVLDPARRRVLVSNGQAPACHGDFVELPLVGTFDRRDFTGLVKRLSRRSSFRDLHRAKSQALQVFIRAKMAYEYDNDAERADEYLRQVIGIDDSNPAYFFQLGIFALKRKQHFDAINAFSRALRCPRITKQLRRLCHYYRGRSHGHLGRPRPAVADLAVVLGDPATDVKLRAAAHHAVWRLKAFGRLPLKDRSLRIMMQQSDMLDY